jgi:O-antigen/teichoic acid export membrane protein
MDKRRLAFGTVANSIASAIKVCLQIIMLPLMARLLGPNEYALYALAMPAILFVMMLADGGLGASLAREPESNDIVWSSAFWVLLGGAIILGIGVIIWASVVGILTHEPRLSSIVCVLSGCLLMYVLTVPSSALLLRHARLILGAVSDIISNSVGAISAIVLALSGAGVWSLVAQSLITYTVRLLIIFGNEPFFPQFKLSFTELRSHATIGGAIVGNKLVDIGDRAVENALVGRNFGASFLGSFSLAYQIARFLGDAVMNPLWLALYVQALHMNDRQRFDAYCKFSRLAALVLFPAAAMGAAETHSLIQILLGPGWSAISPLFQLLLISYCATVIGALGNAILYAKGQTSVQLRITTEMALIRIVSVLCASWIGVWVLWLGLPAANAYGCCRGVIAACRSVNGGPKKLIAPLSIPTACAIVAGLICFGMAKLIQGGFGLLLLEVATTFCLYLLLLIVLDHSRLLQDLADLRRVLLRSRAD